MNFWLLYKKSGVHGFVDLLLCLWLDSTDQSVYVNTVFFPHWLTLYPNCSFPSLLSSQSLLTSPPTIPHPYLLRKGEASQGYQLSLAYQVAVRLGTSSIEAGPHSPIRRQVARGRQQSHWQPMLLHGPTWRPSCISVTCVQRTCVQPNHVLHLVVSVQWFCRFSCGVLDFLAPSILPLCLPQDSSRST